MSRPIKFQVTIELRGHEKSPTSSTHTCEFEKKDVEKANHYCGTLMKAVEAAFETLRKEQV